MSNDPNTQHNRGAGLVVLIIVVTSLLVWYYLDHKKSETNRMIQETKELFLQMPPAGIENQLDSWGHNIRVIEGKDAFDDICVLLTSAGPDGVYETKDDIECLLWRDGFPVRLSRRPSGRPSIPPPPGRNLSQQEREQLSRQMNQFTQVMLEEGGGGLYQGSDNEKMAKNCFYILKPDGSYVKRKN